LSFFEGDVIAKEQLHGVAGVGTGVGVAAPAVPTVGAPKKKKHEPKLKWLPAIRDYLQWKVSA
jgi:hypothetical protein